MLKSSLTGNPDSPFVWLQFQIWNKFSANKHNNIGISSFPGAGDVWFSLKGTTYQNDSIVILEDIGGGDDDALLCITNQTACCQPPYTGDMGEGLGNWFFPNESRVPSVNHTQWDFYRTRGQMVVRMHRRRGGVEGVYHCKIPDTMNVTQTIYIGVYSASTGEWWLYIHPHVLHCKSTCSSVLIIHTLIYLCAKHQCSFGNLVLRLLYTTEQFL